MAVKYIWLGVGDSVRVGSDPSVPLAIPTQSLVLGSETSFLRDVILPEDYISISTIELAYRRTGTGNLYLKFPTAFTANGGGLPIEDTDSYAIYASNLLVGDVRFITVPTTAYDALGAMVAGDTLYLSVYRGADNVLDTFNTDFDVVAFRITINVADAEPTVTSATKVATHTCSTYDELISDTLDEIDREDETSNISPQSMQGYILQACQQISQRIPIEDQTELRLVYGVNKYSFVNSATPVAGNGNINTSGINATGTLLTGTGTISTSARDITGIGTLFLSELKVGRMIVVGTQKKTVLAITSNLSCTLDGNFDTDLSGSAFTYSTTLFTREVNIGSTIISNNIARVVATITDGYNLTVTEPYIVPQTIQSFTVDTKVTEIPTRFSDIKSCNRMEGTIPRNVWVAPYDKLVKRKNSDWGMTNYSNIQQPYMISEWQQGGARYLEVYPPIETDKQVTLFGHIRINPRDYATDDLTDEIPLKQEHDPAIKEYVKYRVYNRIKDGKSAMLAFNLFDSYIKQAIANLPTKREVSVDYN